MARAKRTTRADARRRYRAAITESTVEADDDVDLDPEPERESAPSPASRRPLQGPSRSAGTVSPRPSLLTAFRSSFRPIDVRSDLAALPKLIRHWSFLVAVALSAVGAAAIPVLGTNATTVTLYQYFSGPQPLAPALLVGFFAARASYALGIIVGVASVAFEAIAIGSGGFDAAAAASTPPVSRTDLMGQLPYFLSVAVPMSAFFASAAAWYRRFLRTSTPNRGARQAAAASRRPDGKVPRKPEGRPLLARRR